jgi:hypothetical protein
MHFYLRQGGQHVINRGLLYIFVKSIDALARAMKPRLSSCRRAATKPMLFSAVYVSIRHEAYAILSSIRQHTSRSLRYPQQHTSAYVTKPTLSSAAYVSIRRYPQQHTSAYVTHEAYALLKPWLSSCRRAAKCALSSHRPLA